MTLSNYEIRVTLLDHPNPYVKAYSPKTVISVPAKDKNSAIKKAEKAIANFAGNRTHEVNAYKWC